jgi:uncharacterized RDD family membrane protein YckC
MPGPRAAGAALPREKPASPASSVPLFPKPAPLWRRFAAMVYEALIAAALLLVAGIIFQLLLNGTGLANGAPGWRLTGWPRFSFQIYLTCVLGGYFSWSWHRGQTLAMRTWKLRLVQGPLNRPPSWGAAASRYIGALLLLGPALVGAVWLREHPGSALAWLALLPGAAALGFAVTNEARSTLYDRIAQTRLVVMQ